MGDKKFALLLSASILLVGCDGGDSSKGLSPNNLPKKTTGVTQKELQQEDANIAEAKKIIRTERSKVKGREQNELKERFYWDVPLNHNLQEYIHKLCQQYGVDERLAYGVMKHESNFNPNLISTSDDWGLMQINQCNFRFLKSNLGITNFLDPYQNSLAGIYMLGDLKKKFGSWEMALTAYNRGEGGAKSLIARGSFSSSYSDGVLADMYTIQKEK